MKNLLLFIIIFPCLGFTSLPLELVGEWKAIGYYYEDQFIQPSDPQLTLLFSFNNDGTHRLFWQMKGESSFCERKGDWYLEGDQLFVHTTWVNPANGPSCSADPDMQLNLKTQSTISITDEHKLWIQIPFSDSYMIYVWELVQSDKRSTRSIDLFSPK